jgi:hypothetical protein
VIFVVGEHVEEKGVGSWESISQGLTPGSILWAFSAELNRLVKQRDMEAAIADACSG